MKKVVRTSLNNVANKRGVRDLNIQLYSHDKNNAGFEFVIKNEVDLSEYKAKVLFDFQESFATWETKGTIEGNVVKVKFDTTFITKCEEVMGYLFLDSETDTLDVFKFKFNVVLSEIDKYDTAKRGFRYIKDQEVVDVITRSELEEELKKLQINGGIDLSNYLTTSVAETTYATKQELGDYALKTELPSISGLVTTEQLTDAKNNVVEEINNKGYVTSNVVEETYAKKSDLPAPYNDSALVERVTNLENKTDRDTVYNDTEVKERLTTLENKAPVDLSNYALKSEIPTPYNDSELVQKIGQLEARVDKDTVYDDTPLKERVTALESKAIEGGAYDDTHLRERLDTLEAKQDKDTVYDDTPLKQRVEALETKVDKDTVYNDEEVKQRLTVLENKPAVDTTHFITTETLDSKNYLTTTVAEETYAKKSEIPQAYNDSALVERVTNLENKTDKDTVYDDTNIKERLTNLENKPTVDTTNFVTNEALEEKHYVTNEQISSTYATKSEIPQPYSDTELVKRITVLENRQDNDTVYDDAELKRRVTALEEKPNVDTSNFVTTAILESKGYLTSHQDTSNFALKSELPQPYNDSALVQKIGQLEARVDKDTVYDDTPLKERVTALENRPTSQSEMRGTGMPNGVVEAPIGTTYIDTAKTNGALKWIKTTDGGNTGWKVVEGDTGWVLGWQDNRGNNKNRMYVRRINDVVHVKFNPEIKISDISAETNLILNLGGDELDSDLSIQGFKPVDDIVQTIYRTSRDIYSSTASTENSEGAQGTGAVIIQYKYYRRDKTGLKLEIVTSDLGVDENHVNPFSYLTEDEWPVQLP